MVSYRYSGNKKPGNFVFMTKQTRKVVYMLFILTLVFSSRGMVLCHTDGGHVAIEPPTHNCCRQHHHHEHHPANKQQHTNGPALTECDSCIDVLIDPALLVPLKSSTVPSPETMRVQWLSPDEAAPLGFRFDHSIDDGYPYFSPLASIVLLI